MNNKETRKEKLKILQAIKEGKISPDSLQPPKVYIFTERSNKPGVYEHEGKEYNETEYREFCNKVERKNNNSIILNERREYPQDTIVTFVKHPEAGKKYLTLKI